MDQIALPRELKNLGGQILDVDSHEMIAAQRWGEVFGPEAGELAEAFISSGITDKEDKNASNIPDWAGDTLAVDETVGTIKGARAPGANDIARRLDVMDAMGVKRQLMYPTSVGFWATVLYMNHEDERLLRSIGGDRQAKARTMLSSYNRWMMSEARRSDRIRPVPPVIADTIDELMGTVNELLAAGIKAVWLPSTILPGGVSPAHPDLDPFWAMLAEANCVVTSHVGSEDKFFKLLNTWRDAPAFEGYRALGEFSMDPWFTGNMHVPAQMFMSTLITGGVLERHPTLRVAISELGGYWIGPMMETLDLWYRIGGSSKHPYRLKAPPSTFVKSNFRVSPFDFEDVAGYIERWGLEDVFCFASDYPHVEGGKNAMTTFYNNIQRLGSDTVQKFFATNGQFILPG